MVAGDRGGACYYSGSQGVHDGQNPVVQGEQQHPGDVAVPQRELEQGKGKVIEMTRRNWLAWLIGSPRRPPNA